VIGLPPIPDDVAQLVYFYDVDGSPASTWHWLQHPDLQVMTQGDLEAWWAQLVLDTLAPITSLMATAGSIARVLLRRYGAQPREVLNGVATNHGGAGGCQALLAASGVYWTTPFAGRGGRAYTRWPALPDAFTDDHVRLNSTGYAIVGHESALFRDACNTASAGSFGPGTLVSLHRTAAGVPLAVAQPRVIVGAVPVLRLAAVVRRARS
jgi:hypothetical protein